MNSSSKNAPGDHGDDEPSPVKQRTPAVEVENLRKVYGSDDDPVEAVSGISFDIERGSVVGILGPNGAGKTTSIKSLLSLIVPTEGTVRVAGVDVQRDTSTAFQRMGAVLEGARNMYWRLTVLENMRFFSAIAGQNPNEMKPRHEELLEKFGIADKGDTVVRELSRGQKQKVSIACTLARDAEVVFLDEPTLGLDIESSIELRKELRSLAVDEGTTVVLSSHDMDVIEEVCDRVIIMNDGRIITDESVDNLLSVLNAQAYKVTTQESLDKQLREQLRAKFSLKEVNQQNGVYEYNVQIVGDEFYDIVDILRKHDVSIESFDAVDVDLEDVFLHLTGEDDEKDDETDDRMLAEVSSA